MKSQGAYALTSLTPVVIFFGVERTLELLCGSWRAVLLHPFGKSFKLVGAVPAKSQPEQHPEQEPTQAATSSDMAMQEDVIALSISDIRI
jgi:hypothetical protein